MQIEDQLRDVLQRSMRGVDPPVRDLVTVAVRDGRAGRRRSVAAWAAGAAACAAIAAGVAARVATTGPGDHPAADGPTGTSTASAGTCDPAREGVLPTWAWAGFSDPEPVVVHATSDHGRIIAVLFGRVLHAPPSDEVNNKILWVSPTDTGEPLRIDAVHAGTRRSVQREVAGGPGPSIIDLPTAGCWRLMLRWGDAADQRDTMDLEYVAPQ